MHYILKDKMEATKIYCVLVHNGDDDYIIHRFDKESEATAFFYLCIGKGEKAFCYETKNLLNIL